MPSARPCSRPAAKAASSSSARSCSARAAAAAISVRLRSTVVTLPALRTRVARGAVEALRTADLLILFLTGPAELDDALLLELAGAGDDLALGVVDLARTSRGDQ